MFLDPDERFYASALLVPCWQLMTLCLYAGPVALDNVVLCSSVDVLKGWLDSFSFGCLNVGVYLSSS